MKKDLSRIIVKGGVLSPVELKSIAEFAESMGMNTLLFGSRQDILLPDAIDLKKVKDFGDLQLIPTKQDGNENIVSSYLSHGIFPSTSWLTGDRYLYILEQLKRKPRLKINITDPKQRLVPLFTGHLNFIASAHEDYWYLYIRLPQWETTEMYQALIHSWDIAKVSDAIENILQEEPADVAMIFDLVIDALDTNSRTIDKSLDIPFYPFPYYEGMNRIGNDQYWLGLYWRNNRYDTAFLKVMCDLCAESKIGKISITPWKSLIIKGIPIESKLKWEKFLGKFGINVRHSMLELNWHLPVNNQEARDLKIYLVSNFDKNDISTYGLTFAITHKRNKANYFTSIVIQKNSPIEALSDIELRETYNLLYAKNFDPNTRKYIVHVQDVDKVELPNLLMELSRMYFDQLGDDRNIEPTAKAKKDAVKVEVYQCPDCLTIYDPVYGDATQAILPNTLFNNLPEDYHCPLCDATKDEFKPISLEKEIS